MRRRTLLLLGGAAAVAVGAVVLLAPERVERSELAAADAAGGALALPGLAPRLAGAQRIEVRRGPDALLALDRRGEVWVLPDRGGYPVRPERVRELLVGLTELRLVERRTADPAQLDRLGLDDQARPGTTAVLLRVLDGGGAPIAELVVGRRRVRTQGNVPETVYVRRPDESQSWLAEGRLPADGDAQLWIDRDVANLGTDRIRRVAVRREGGAPLVLTRGDGPEARLALVDPADGPALDEVSVDEVARAFEYLTFTEVRPEAEMPGDAAALGEARFELTGDLAVTVRPHKEAEALWVRLAAEGGTPEAERLNARWAGWAYQVGPWKEKAFLPRLEDLTPRGAASAPTTAADAPPSSAGGEAPPSPAGGAPPR